jgi:hypothetical protein
MLTLVKFADATSYRYDRCNICDKCNTCDQCDTM